MKAMIYEKYGSTDALELRVVETPTPKDNEVLIKVLAASVNAIDYRFLMGTPFLARILAGGLLSPKRKVLGVDVAGRVDAVGASVKSFKLGDEVFGLSFINGAFAEYFCAPEDQILMIRKPPSISFEHAAAVPCSATAALMCLRDCGQVQAGQKVLINGAAGAVGSFAVQIAKAYGAEVTGVCSTANFDTVRAIGAEHVIDYTREDFAQREGHYDLVYDAVRKRSFSDCRRALTPRGTYVTTAWSPLLALQEQWIARTRNQKMVPMNPMVKPQTKDLQHLSDLLEEGKVRPVIDRRHPLSELPEALRHYATGHARGKIVITIGGEKALG